MTTRQPCPRCDQMNTVAGLFYVDLVGTLHGATDCSVICGFCGRRFDAQAQRLETPPRGPAPAARPRDGIAPNF